MQDALAGLLARGLGELSTEPVDPDRIETLLAYQQLLLRWNKTYNLTAVRDPEQMVTRHLLDSLAVLPWVGTGPLLDAGTGAGLPGIPLAIVRPELEVTLLDSAGKKIRFLNHVVRQLELAKVRTLQARLESWVCDRPMKTIISRAFSDIGTFARSSKHLAGRGTRLLAMKGKHPGAELEDLPTCWRLDAIEELHVPGLQEARHLVIMSFIPGI
jgi:16S rRNA (guanine527-N7)-methyltransferase